MHDYVLTDLEQRIAKCVETFTKYAREVAIFVTADGRISETDASKLLGINLKSARSEGRGPTAYTRPLKGSKWSYRISDLAQWIEEGHHTAGDEETYSQRQRT